MAVRVLIADDHGLMRCGLKHMVEKIGYEVAGEASDGLEAVEQFKLLSPDLVLMDISMDHLNGIDAARRICALGSDTKVLVVSMHVDKKYVGEAFNVGARGYLHKSSACEEFS